MLPGYISFKVSCHFTLNQDVRVSAVLGLDQVWQFPCDTQFNIYIENLIFLKFLKDYNLKIFNLFFFVKQTLSKAYQ